MRRFEQLEAKLLLAGDLACGDDADDEAAEVASDDSLLSATAITIRDAGSTMGSALDIGQLGATTSYNGSVGGSDLRDVMRFSLAAQSTVSLSLSGLVRDIDLGLYDATGRRLALSENAGTASELISVTLGSGTYYVAVTPYRRAYSTYVLTVGATAVTPTPVTNPTTPPTTTPPTTTPVTSFPDVAYYGGANDWNINSINAPESWARGYTGAGVTVAVVDTGVDLDHPDLVSQIWVNADEIAGNGIDDDRNGYVDDVHGWDFSSGDSNPDDGNGHGTHVAGTIAADNNGSGATGVAYDATIMPVRVLANNGSGTASGVAAGIRYAVQNGADIINLSLGGGFSSVILSAIQYALQSNVLVVAAAGNESASVPGYPAIFSASLANVLSVGAYSSASAIASFSNDVGASGAVQVDAPGVGVYSTWLGGTYRNLSGTSMATPHVAGLAALALSANGNLTASQLRTLIVNGTDRTIAGSDSQGGVNAAITVALAAAGQVSTSSAAAATQTATSTQSAAVRRIVFSSVGEADEAAPSAVVAAPQHAASDSGSPLRQDFVARETAAPSAVRELALAALEDALDDEFTLCDVLAEAESHEDLFGDSPADELSLLLVA
jgi:subtilisin family serine protease